MTQAMQHRTLAEVASMAMRIARSQIDAVCRVVLASGNGDHVVVVEQATEELVYNTWVLDRATCAEWIADNFDADANP